MKKATLIVILALASIGAQAQLVTTTSRSIKVENTPSNMIWLVRAGLTFASYNEDEVKSRTGFNVGVEFQKPFNRGFYWGAGLGLKSKGYKEKLFDSTLTLTALEIPLNIGYKFDLSSDVKLDLHAGAFANVDLFGKLKSSYGEVSIGDFEKYSRLGGGLSAGAGIWYQQFNFNLTIQWGLLEQWDLSSAKESNILLSLGYAF